MKTNFLLSLAGFILSFTPVAQAELKWFVPDHDAQNCLFISKNDTREWWTNEQIQSLADCQLYIQSTIVIMRTNRDFSAAFPLGKIPMQEFVNDIESGYMAFIPNGKDLKNAIRCKITLKRDGKGNLVPFPADLDQRIQEWGDQASEKLVSLVRDLVHLRCTALTS